jgi:hypothetical protein
MARRHMVGMEQGKACKVRDMRAHRGAEHSLAPVSHRQSPDAAVGMAPLILIPSGAGTP